MRVCVCVCVRESVCVREREIYKPQQLGGLSPIRAVAPKYILLIVILALRPANLPKITLWPFAKK